MSGCPRLAIRYDLRLAGADGPARAAHLDTALEQICWAEKLGFDSVLLSEHHGSSDGYLPSPIVLAAAVATRTSTIRITLGALIAPFHDPLRLAEDLAVLDLLARGRLVVIIGSGYLPSEFEMLGKNIDDRTALAERAVETLKAAWTGEPFTYEGRTVRVTPRPYGTRPVILLGGQTRAAARRAARIADGYAPIHQKHNDEYRRAVTELGGTDPGPSGPSGPRFLYVAEDPDRAWSRIASYCLHETNAYAEWAHAAGVDNGYTAFADADALRRSGSYPVVTPDDCIELCLGLGPRGTLMLHPLMGGLPADLSWESLELFERRVLPTLNVADVAASIT